MSDTLNQVGLMHLLNYNSLTGIFTWRNPTNRKSRVGDEAGTINMYGYIVIKLNGKVYRAHRLAWLYVVGEFPVEMLDHINRIKIDNRIINLNPVSNEENQRNRKLNSNNKSGFIGVRICNKTNKWLARITVKRKKIDLGLFDKKSDAVLARINAEKEYGFSKTHGT